MTAVLPTPASVTTIGARPADPVTQIRKAADRLLDLPATSLVAAMAGVLTTAAGDMYGRGAYELPGADGEPLVADPAGPRPDWSAALGLARAVLTHRDPAPAVAGVRPKTVTICGSTRFRTAMTAVNYRLTLAGAIVLAPGVFGHDGDPLTDDDKNRLDTLHLRKIDASDEIVVVNVGGYIGESTRAEIAYARSRRIMVTFLVDAAGEPKPWYRQLGGTADELFTAAPVEGGRR
ncbi:hypothetical protein [Actinoplanes sp. G11-F43]|uniref:hypothetical protein n=1 Tax=Actinoplanes sp. G11-F43 TaxID=3424130 RepID=UPI003D34222D